MQYITLEGENYEEAVKKARMEYGDDIRIHSRRDYTTGGGLFTKKKKHCEITCYILEKKKDESQSREEEKRDIKEFIKEAKTPDPTLNKKEGGVDEKKNNKSEGEKLLSLNYITGALKSKLLDYIIPDEDVRETLSEKILEYIPLDYNIVMHPGRILVFLGPTGTGKTTTLMKLSSLYKNTGKKVALITLDTYRIGAKEQIKAYSDSEEIPLREAEREEDLLCSLELFSSYDLILVDTMGLSRKDIEQNLRLKSLGMILSRHGASFFLVVPASMKEEDMSSHEKRYKKDFTLSGMIVTKVDESETIGNALSFSYSSSLPLLFFTDGQRVPDDIEKVSSELILENLNGFGLDIKRSRRQLN